MKREAIIRCWQSPGKELGFLEQMAGVGLERYAKEPHSGRSSEKLAGEMALGHVLGFPRVGPRAAFCRGHSLKDRSFPSAGFGRQKNVPTCCALLPTAYIQ